MPSTQTFISNSPVKQEDGTESVLKQFALWLAPNILFSQPIRSAQVSPALWCWLHVFIPAVLIVLIRFYVRVSFFLFFFSFDAYFKEFAFLHKRNTFDNSFSWRLFSKMKFVLFVGDRTNAILWDVSLYSEGVTTIIENRSVVRTSNEKSERRSCYQRNVMEEFKRDKLQ